MLQQPNNAINVLPVDTEAEHFHKRIHCRSGHITVRYRDQVLVWGGSREVNYDDGMRQEYHDPREIMVYDCRTEVWTQHLTAGHIPLRCSGACGVVLNNYLYVFGGFQVIFEDFYDECIETMGNSLHQLDLRTLIWRELKPTGVIPWPCDKLVGWKYNGKLYFFGGFGPMAESLANVPFKYVRSNSEFPDRGWNNQFLCYDPKSNSWSWPATKGPTPLPKAAHAADIRNGKAYIFGGRLLENRVNELYCIDMETMRWSENLTKHSSQAPEGRSWHSFTFINDTTAITYGGFSSKDMILSDVWSFDTKLGHWKCLKKCGIPRLWHCAVYFSRQAEVAIIGGYKTTVYHTDRPELADSLLTLNFQPKSLFRFCLRACVSYAAETQHRWNLLPMTVQKALKARLEQVQFV